jgi:hypothetical protein
VSEQPRASVSAVADYKEVLKRVLDNRPSGTRQRLASALGKNRSFISQIASPSYSIPIPARHIDTIFHVCHFSVGEQRAFLEAYRRAHPRAFPGKAAPGSPQGQATSIESGAISEHGPSGIMVDLKAKRSGRGRRLAEVPRTRTLTITVPDLGDKRRNRAIDDAVADLVHRLARLSDDLLS